MTSIEQLETLSNVGFLNKSRKCTYRYPERVQGVHVRQLEGHRARLEGRVRPRCRVVGVAAAVLAESLGRPEARRVLAAWQRGPHSHGPRAAADVRSGRPERRLRGAGWAAAHGVLRTPQGPPSRTPDVGPAATRNEPTLLAEKRQGGCLLEDT